MLYRSFSGIPLLRYMQSNVSELNCLFLYSNYNVCYINGTVLALIVSFIMVRFYSFI